MRQRTENRTAPHRTPVPFHGGAPQWLSRQVRRFAAREDGSLIIFALYAFLIVLMFGGIGIDLMRYERERATLQYTMDRAVLAAADLDQTLKPKDVVKDYLEKAGLGDFLTSVTVDEGMSYRTVSATASADIATHFMHMTGVDTLTAPAASTAEERIDGVEISLVLDVSGSMNSNSRLTNLKIAAKEFVDTMIDNTEDGKMSMSIVPYAQQVSMPAAFLDQLNVTDEHAYSNCVNFDSTDFYSAALSTTAELKRTMHFDYTSTSFDGRDNSPPKLVTNPVCIPDSDREAMVMQKNATKLKSFISDLWAGGYTSIDLGMKWGTALLDPSVKPAISAMIDLGEVSDDFSERPYTYESGETLKVVVLMTDGENTRQYYLPDEYRTGATDAWWNAEEEVYSVRTGPDEYDRDGDGDTEEDIYYWNEKGKWADHPYGDGTESVTEKVCTVYWWGHCWEYKYVTTEGAENGTAVELSKADLFAYTSPKKIADSIFNPTMGYSEARSEWYYGPLGHYVDGSAKNTRTEAICDAAKAQGIIVYTIAFEANSTGRAVLKDCASSDSHYFDVDGLEISDAFASIASSIRKLRLTQ